MTSLWNRVRTVLDSYGTRKETLITLIDREGNLYSMNAEMRKMLDITIQEKAITNIFDLTEHAEKLKQSVLSSAEKNIPADSTFHFKNGRDHLVSMKIHPLPAADREKQLFLCMGEEIKKKQEVSIEKELPLSVSDKNQSGGTRNITDLFESALYHSPILTWMINEAEQLVFANKAYRKFFQLTDAAINQDIRKFIPHHIIESLYEKHVDALRANKTVSSFEKAFLADGSTLHFQVLLYPAMNAEGQKIITGQACLIPEQPQQQHKAPQDENLQINNNRTDAVWEWDIRKGKISRNNVLQKMTGFINGESNDLAWWLSRIHSEDRDRVSKKIQQATDKQLLAWEDKYRFQCADGMYKDIHDHGYLVYENGQAVKMIGSLQDISEIKKLQALLDKEKLDRQQELSETIMHVQERERAWIGYELHDNINQILTTVNLFIDQLKVNGTEQKNLKNKSTEYLVQAIEEIRNLSKGLVVPHLKEKGLVESIRSMVSDLNVSDALRIDFKHDYKPAAFNTGRQLTLFRIVQEQLKNILKHSGASIAEVHLTCKKDVATLIISDNGKGFDPAQTNRGIGLANIYERARFYNGNTAIDTAPGKGCSLQVSIPCE